VSNAAEDLKKVVELAEAAVSAVKDPELRRAAFEKVLERLLAKPEPADALPRERHSARAAPAKPGKAVTNGKSGPTSRVEEMIREGFFAGKKTLGEVRSELGTRGFHIESKPLSMVMLRLCRKKMLRRQGSGGDGAYGYSNW
jgi:hypothetical protein